MSSRVLVTGRQGSVVESLTRAAEELGVLDTRDDQPRARASFVEADSNHDGGGLDAIAGSEFVDDRIRLVE